MPCATRPAADYHPAGLRAAGAVLRGDHYRKGIQLAGAGHIHIDSLAARDYPVLMGFTLFLAVLTIVGNLLADVLYARADPRIRVRS